MSNNIETKMIVHQLRKEFYKNRDYETAFSLASELVHRNVPWGFFICGLILEQGWLNGNHDYKGAMIFFRALIIKFDDDEGYLGCVRVALATHDVDSIDQVKTYCVRATNGKLRRLAYTLLGRVYEELYSPPEYQMAKAEYLKSFASGSVWALRMYANSATKSGHPIYGLIMHIATTIISPFFVLFGGFKTTRQG